MKNLLPFIRVAILILISWTIDASGQAVSLKPRLGAVVPLYEFNENDIATGIATGLAVEIPVHEQLAISIEGDFTRNNAEIYVPFTTSNDPTGQFQTSDQTFMNDASHYTVGANLLISFVLTDKHPQLYCIFGGGVVLADFSSGSDTASPITAGRRLATVQISKHGTQNAFEIGFSFSLGAGVQFPISNHVSAFFEGRYKRCYVELHRATINHFPISMGISVPLVGNRML